MSNEENLIMSLDDGLKELEAEEKSIKEQKAAESAKPKDIEDSSNDQIPEKFKGKSVEDVLASYKELERHLGRQANEIGELKQMVAKSSSRVEEYGEQEEEDLSISFDDVVENPTDAVGKLVSKQMKSVTDKLDTYEKKEAQANFQKDFPDFQNDLADEDFQKWVTESPYRQKLITSANNYDTDAARELWGSWYERKDFIAAASKQEGREDQAALDKALNAAVTESSSTGASSEKYIPREEIQNLRLKDPDKYNAMADKIAELYRQGKIR